MAQQEQRFKGLQWVQETFSLEPQWTIEPNESTICTIEQDRSQGQKVVVSFLTQGAFNKIYNLQVGNQTFIMRVSLPVDPQYKTLSEVATLDWVQRFTSLPVPVVISYQANQDNPLGFEWILMEKMPGKRLADAWMSMQFSAKEQLVRKFVAYSSCLFKNQLCGIGNIYPDSSILPRSPVVKRIVSMQFFWGDHILQDVPRGPFCSGRDWIFSYLSFNEHDCNSILAKYENRADLGSDDEDEIDDAMRTLQIINRLKSHVSEIFPDCDQDLEPSMLFHDDLNQHNILVDDNGILTGVVDWECVSALPLWKACDYPCFLESKSRYAEELDRNKYDKDDPDTLYWEHLMEYEQTKLRRYFLDEMRQLEPKWIEVFESATTKRDFYVAIQNCDDVFMRRHINDWLDDIDSGKGPLRSLRARIYDE
ncbi:Phosphotransferase enzyme family domain containing protein [Elaphomyces granulatus]